MFILVIPKRAGGEVASSSRAAENARKCKEGSNGRITHVTRTVFALLLDPLDHCPWSRSQPDGLANPIERNAPMGAEAEKREGELRCRELSRAALLVFADQCGM